MQSTNKAKSFMGAVGLIAMASTVAFCGPSAESFCDAKCDCEGRCGNHDFANCLDEYDGDERSADRLGCLDLFDEYASCVESGDGCLGLDADELCDFEKDRWRNCVRN